MRLYYTSRPVLFCMCAGNELFYASLYLLNFTSGPFYIFNIGKFTYYVFLKKQVITFETKMDRNTLYKYFLISVAMVCFPIAIAKSAIALLQGYLACINLGSVDVEERAQAAKRRD